MCGINAQEEQVCSDPCSSGCVQTCPYEFWTPGEWDAVWLIRLIPYLLSLPFNAIVVASEVVKYQKARKGKKGGDPLILTCGLVALLYAACEALPSAALGKDMYCDGVTW